MSEIVVITPDESDIFITTGAPENIVVSPGSPDEITITPWPGGPVGPVGPDGPVGPTGPTGPQGDQGLTGPQGDRGTEGPIGPQGDQGVVGPIGPQGAQGTSTSLFQYAYGIGTTPPPSQGTIRTNGSAELATMLWIDREDATNADVKVALMVATEGSDVYVQDKGDSTCYARYVLSADPIDNGEYVTMPVSFVEAGTTPLGNDNNRPILFGVIVVGQPGPQGPTGVQGPTGAQGPQGVQGVIGPQGVEGATGTQGPIGVQGPQGVVGPQGPLGPTGANSTVPGPQGPIGVTGPQGPPSDEVFSGPADPGPSFEFWFDTDATTAIYPGRWAQMTQAQYDALAVKQANTLYVIVG